MVRIDFRLEQTELAELQTEAAAELRWMAMSAVCRMAVMEWVRSRRQSRSTGEVDVQPLPAASSGVLPTALVDVPPLQAVECGAKAPECASNLGYGLSGTDLALKIQDLGSGEEKRDQNKTVAAASGGKRRSVHKRARQTTLIDDEATQAATAFILALNEIKGGRYETECGAFKETVRMVRWHMDNDHRTESDFVLVARWSWGAWKGGIQEKNCNPDTLLRQSLFGKYLAEARAAAPVNATPEDKARSKAEQQAIWDKMDAESRAEQARIEAMCGGFFNK
jgi:hypothetical protein